MAGKVHTDSEALYAVRSAITKFAGSFQEAQGSFSQCFEQMNYQVEDHIRMLDSDIESCEEEKHALQRQVEECEDKQSTAKREQSQHQNGRTDSFVCDRCGTRMMLKVYGDSTSCKSSSGCGGTMHRVFNDGEYHRLNVEIQQLEDKKKQLQERIAVLDERIGKQETAKGRSVQNYSELQMHQQLIMSLLVFGSGEDPETAVAFIDKALASLGDYQAVGFDVDAERGKTLTPEKSEAPAVNSKFNAENDVPIIPRESALDRRLKEIFPESRRPAIDEAFADAPQRMIDAINGYAEGLKHIKDSGYTINQNGERVKEGCYYMDGSDTIVMDERMTNAEYAEVFTHEFGHYIDCQRGWESTGTEFTEAIQRDAASMDKSTPEGKMRLHDMLDDAFSTGAAYDRAVSDIISAIFRNDSEIVRRFDDENVAYYRHTRDYWNIPGMIQKEIYANNMSIQVGQARISKNFIERWFGNLDECFKTKFNVRQ